MWHVVSGIGVLPEVFAICKWRQHPNVRVRPRSSADGRAHTQGNFMARVFITGSADGLGRLAAQTLLADGHEVVVHARDDDRLAAVRDLVDRGAAAVVGDLADLDETRSVADQVNDLG